MVKAPKFCGATTQRNIWQQQKKAVMHATASQAVTYEPNWVNKNKERRSMK